MEVSSTITRSSTTVSQTTRILTQTSTSTAYVAPNGSTITVMKRSIQPTRADIAGRAVVTPSYLRGLRKTDVRAACQCLSLATPTYTAKRTMLATGELHSLGTHSARDL